MPSALGPVALGPWAYTSGKSLLPMLRLLHTYIRAYVHTYIHTYMHAYKHTNIHTFKTLIKSPVFIYHYCHHHHHL